LIVLSFGDSIYVPYGFYQVSMRGRDSDFVYSGWMRLYHHAFKVIGVNGSLVERKSVNETFYFDMVSAWVEKKVNDRYQIECIPADSVPPLSEIYNVLMNGKLLKEGEHDPKLIGCEGYLEMWKFYFLDESFIVCKFREERFKLVSIKFEMDIIYDDKLSRNRPLFKDYSCKKSIYQHKTYNIGLKGHKNLNEVWFKGKRSLNSHLKACVFLHGSGVLPTDIVPISTFEYYYWGNIRIYTQYNCLNHTFSYSDTVFRGWNDTNLQKEYCNVLTQDQIDKFYIRNKIIFSHSLGNLILAAAIENDICRIDTTTTTWYESMGPYKGSPVAFYLKSICNSTYIPNIVKNSICYKDLPLPAYTTLYPHTPGLDRIKKLASKYINGSICGTSAAGITTSYSVGLYAVAKMVGLSDLNDGLVDYESCITDKNIIYSDSCPESNFYNATVNHADGTCRNNDGWFGGSRKPCTWYSMRV
jgi:hypothetical protein